MFPLPRPRSRPSRAVFFYTILTYIKLYSTVLLDDPCDRNRGDLHHEDHFFGDPRGHIRVQYDCAFAVDIPAV